MAESLKNKIEAFFYDELSYSVNSDSSRTEPTPEHRLCVAVLARAIVDAVQPVEAVQWYEGFKDVCRMDALRFFRRNSREPFSFLWLCDVLALDPDYLRRRIKETIEANDPQETFHRLFPRRKRFRFSMQNMH
jgi:hypothetical protein